MRSRSAPIVLCSQRSVAAAWWCAHLDAGSDKPLPFLGHAEEPNPALGVRGFRTAASYPEVLHDQLKAIKEAAEAESAEVWVMAPMIATVDEVRSFGHAARSRGPADPSAS